MYKRGILGLLLLGLIVALAGCGSSGEKDAKTKDSKSAEMPATPQIKPGEMVLVAAGKFIMGSDEKGEDGKVTPAYPQRELELPAFYIDKYEVTNGEFLKFTADTGYISEADAENKSWRLFFSPERVNYPAVNLTWDDAQAYAKWAGKRLLTEAEWEKAARGTEGRRYPWGNEWKPGRCNTAEAGFKEHREIATFVGDESPYGAMDMLGNVQEWVSDWYKAYPGNSKKEKEFGEIYRCARGASSRHKGKTFALWMRAAYEPKALFSLGVRCAKDAPKAAMTTDPSFRQRELDRRVQRGFARIAEMVNRSFGAQVALSTKHFK